MARGFDIGSVVKRILPYHQQEIDPVVRHANFSRVGLKSTVASHVSMGDYYELVTRGLYGGSLLHRRDLDDDEFTKPDVVDIRRKAIGEAKAVRVGYTCALLDNQLRRYINLQFINPASNVYFAFYRHTFARIKSYDGNKKELFRALAKQTVCSVVLPLSVVMALHASKDRELVRRYESNTSKELPPSGAHYPSCSVVSSSALNRFLATPDEMIKRIGLAPSDFVIDRVLSPRPFHVARSSMQQFPIIRIKDKDHASWSASFIASQADECSDGYSDELEPTASSSIDDIADVPF